MTGAPYRDRIVEQLDRPLEADAQALARTLAARPGVLAVLFYGNRLRNAGATGLLDFYVLTAANGAYHGHGLSALANHLVPPNVYHLQDSDRDVAAKVAVMRLDAFQARMRRMSWDTTLWARFSQPSVLAFAADEQSRDAVIAAVTKAYETGYWWAARLAPPCSDYAQVWTALYAHTYGAELRVEGGGRAGEIVGKSPELYDRIHQDLVGEDIPETARRAARRAWTWRRRAGKALNLMRLIKAAFTFRGGISYALSKVEKHSGAPVKLGPIARRLPWLAAPFIMIRLLLEKRLR